MINAVGKLRLAPNTMEFFGARTKMPLETCLEEVRQSDIVIVIVGNRYGSIVPRRKVSFSEAEYNEAHRLEKPILVYVRAGRSPSIKGDDSFERLARWKAKLLRRHTVARFTTGSSLAVQVAADVSRAASSLNDGADVWTQLVGYVSLFAKFDGSLDKWLSWIRRRRSKNHLLGDLPLVYWIKEQSERDPEFLPRVCEVIKRMVEPGVLPPVS